MEPTVGPADGPRYGRACMNCSRAKCRCIARPSSQGCERCHRLNKPCTPGDFSRKRNAQKNNPIARIAQLEGKLDGLVSLLQASPAQIGPQAEAVALPPPPSNPSTYAGSNSTAPTPTSSGLSPAAFEPSVEEVDEGLGIFRTRMLKFFPFLHLTDDIQWLRQERPFLFLCIIAVSSKSTPRRFALCKEIKQTLAQRIFLDGQGLVNLDLLLGLLTFLSWGNDQLLNCNPHILSRFTQLAMTITFELRLNHPFGTQKKMLPVEKSPEDCFGPTGTTRTLEERRALLGCYIMSSIISSYFGQIDPLRSSPYIEECIAVISQSRECPSDEAFALQARSHLIAREAEDAKNNGVPPTFYAKALQSKLVDMRASLSTDFQPDETSIAAMDYAEVSFRELVLSKDMTGFRRAESLYDCLIAVKSALDHFLKIPSTDYVGISFPVFTHLARCIIILYKLSTMKDPSWDTGLVRSTIDLIPVLDQVISNLDQAGAMTGDGSEDGIFPRTSQLFMSVKSWCSAKLSDETQDAESEGLRPEAAGDMAMTLSQESTLLDSLHDDWLTDMLNCGTLDGFGMI
ncbi:hypothetical protein GQ53DRAFT_843406 [Thozetella sp. PMI_491]|nr:hypothetical protein GQ53DRAFT_843406 [Thozetella sp. PMI_491]